MSSVTTITNITDAEFQTTVLEATQPVLVYFWAAWCGPCRLMMPIINTVAADYGDRLCVVKIEIDPNPDAVKHCKVEGVPAFRLFKGGELLVYAEGVLPKPKLDEILAPHI